MGRAQNERRGAQQSPGGRGCKCFCRGIGRRGRDQRRRGGRGGCRPGGHGLGGERAQQSLRRARQGRLDTIYILLGLLT